MQDRDTVSRAGLITTRVSRSAAVDEYSCCGRNSELGRLSRSEPGEGGNADTRATDSDTHGLLAVASAMRVVRRVCARAPAHTGAFGATVASSIMIATDSVRSGRPESTATFIFRRLGTKQRPRSGVAPPLECLLRPSCAGAVCSCVDCEKYFALQLLEYRFDARPLLAGRACNTALRAAAAPWGSTRA